MGRIEVYPLKSGEWRVQRRDEDDKTKGVGKGSENRGDAIAQALEHRDSTEAVVLLRPDGSLYGELAHAQTGNTAQGANIEPASENGEAS